GNTAYGEHPPVDLLTSDNVVKSVTERVFPKHADHERITGVFKGFRRPFDEFGEIVQKRRLYLILVGRPVRVPGGDEPYSQNERETQSGKHGVFPAQLKSATRFFRIRFVRSTCAGPQNHCETPHAGV